MLLSPGLQRGFASLVASGVAEVVTLPIDKAKVMQQKSEADGLSIFGCLTDTVDCDGVSACWAGLTPALLRQCLYSSLTLALYDPIVAFFGIFLGGYLLMLWSGGLAGAISIFVFNWTEVLKTQAQLRRENVAAIAQRIYRTDGLLGFWAGGALHTIFPTAFALRHITPSAALTVLGLHCNVRDFACGFGSCSQAECRSHLHRDGL